MFDQVLPEIAELASLSDAELVDAARGWVRTENAACARKLAVMAEIFARRTGLPAGDREQWWIDPQAAVAAELAAAVNVSRGMALHQTHRGVALRDRLPAVAALFEAGLISDLLVRTIVGRTFLIEDEAAMAAVDAALANRVTRWGALSLKKTEAAIDALVDEHDPGALRRSRESASSPTVEFGSPTDVAGTTSMWARLNSPDAALIENAVEELAHSVCDADPRCIDERRANALTALAARTGLACGCGDPDCPAASKERPAKNTVVYVIADHASLDGQTGTPPGEPDPCDGPDGPDGPGDPVEGPDDAPEAADEPGGSGDAAAQAPGDTAATNGDGPAAAPAKPARCAAPPAFVFGAGVIPTALLGGLIEGARFREVRHPGVSTPPEPRYVPSRRTAEFVRCRDLTCRFPGCDRPAQFCDLDHTVAYPVGPTHPSNLKCLCRFHHLLKTFWGGHDGWRDKQLPDGTVIWTSPTGHTYATYPGSRHLFPSLCEPTATLWTGDPPEPPLTERRGAMMPRRRRTRAQATAKAKAAERKLNDPLVAERNQPPPF